MKLIAGKKNFKTGGRVIGNQIRKVKSAIVNFSFSNLFCYQQTNQS